MGNKTGMNLLDWPSSIQRIFKKVERTIFSIKIDSAQSLGEAFSALVELNDERS